MTSPSILPDNVNTLLIRNENVWTNGRYWKITFSDPLFLKQLLRNEISRDSLDRPVACHSMKPGHFFVVETERFRYTCVFTSPLTLADPPSPSPIRATDSTAVCTTRLVWITASSPSSTA